MKFNYQGYGRNESYCNIEVTGNLVIATELPDNPGTSITNAAEEVATAVCRRFQIPMEELIWIERYHHSPDEYDQVTFFFDGEKLINPVWSRIQGEDLQQLMRQYMQLEGREIDG